MAEPFLTPADSPIMNDRNRWLTDVAQILGHDIHVGAPPWPHMVPEVDLPWCKRCRANVEQINNHRQACGG